MREKTEEFEAFRARMQAFHLPRTKELPNVGLYMDQVLGVLTDYLSPLEIGRRDDFITSSMINNYVKQGLIKPPKNKKYDKSQICYLIVICILKKVYAIGEIKTLLIVSSADKDRDELRDAYHSFCECIENALHAPSFPPIDWQEELLRPFGTALALSVGMKIYEQQIIALKTAMLAEMASEAQNKEIKQ